MDLGTLNTIFVFLLKIGIFVLIVVILGSFALEGRVKKRGNFS